MKYHVKKNHKNLVKAFGIDPDSELVDLPVKISGTKISRLLVGEWMGCSMCFPHGRETCNSKYDKWTRSWKKYRKTQWK